MKKTYITLTPIALVATMMMSQAYAKHTVLDDVVVTASPMTAPVTVEMDPKVPRQPLPAHDGADYLKTIPGFAVMRKGGTDGEAIFRGMAGSRLNILVDDQNIVGGCSFRMDAPTAYIFPEAYDKLTVIKGPQTVEYANMGTAATVKFDREPKKYEKNDSSAYLSGLVGGFGRHDEIVEAETGNQSFYGRVTATNSQSGNYKDGSGREYHSGYHRWSTNGLFGLTPDDHTRIELSAARSDGWAKYPDRGMDGTKFLRENIAAKFEKKNISNLVDSVSFQISRNEVDHIMDDIRFRSGSMGSARVGHEASQIKLATNLSLAEKTKLKTGVDLNIANHTKELVDDSQFDSKGVFAELTHQIGKQDKLISGLRVDQWKVDDKRGAYSATSSISMGSTTYTYTGSDTSGQERKETTKSIFGRYEHAHSSNITSYVGLGYAERFPDYWELIAMSRDNQAHSSLQTLKKERVTQLDIGSLYKYEKLSGSVSAFYNQINDFILINYNSNSMMRRNLNGISSNIDARTYGLESNISYLLSHHWKASGSVAYVRGEDRTNNAALPQLPPLEGRLGLNYDDTKWSYGALLRLATSQNRYRIGYGNIAGQDLAGSGGFAVFSLNAGYKANKKVKFAFGVDNLFDKTYAEFVSRTGSPSMGAPSINPRTTRVNEPGRTAWLKATIALD